MFPSRLVGRPGGEHVGNLGLSALLSAVVLLSHSQTIGSRFVITNGLKSICSPLLDQSMETTLESILAQHLPSDDAVESDCNWRDITLAMARGDADALTQFYRRQFDCMFREARRCSGRDESTCLDLVQEAMLKAIRCIKPLDSQVAVDGWSRAVVKSVTWDWFRKQTRRPQPSRLSLLPSDEQPLEGPVQGESLEMAARTVWLEQELKQLPNELQSMIALRYRLGWSLKQIGARFGMKTGAVDGRIRRAVDRLKQKAAEVFDDE